MIPSSHIKIHEVRLEAGRPTGESYSADYGVLPHTLWPLNCLMSSLQNETSNKTTCFSLYRPIIYRTTYQKYISDND